MHQLKKIIAFKDGKDLQNVGEESNIVIKWCQSIIWNLCICTLLFIREGVYSPNLKKEKKKKIRHFIR